MIRYYITDRRALIGGESALLRNIERIGGEVDYLQVREKDLSARELLRLTRMIVAAVPQSVRVLVNDRADIAIAAGAAGVHLRGNAIAPFRLRAGFPGRLMISVSCHSLGDVKVADQAGADLILLAPIFEMPGKRPALGMELLAQAASASKAPVIALGGVSAERIAECLKAGAAGVAGIRLFQRGAVGSAVRP